MYSSNANLKAMVFFNRHKGAKSVGPSCGFAFAWIGIENDLKSYLTDFVPITCN